MVNRRDFLKGLSASAVGLILPMAQGGDLWSMPRELLVHRQGIGTYRVLFWEQGEVVRDGYIALCHLLSDVQESVSVQIDPGLMNLLFAMQTWARRDGIQSAIQITSGYRTPEHNSRLEGAAKNSMHLHGRAADVRMDGLSARALAGMAAWFKAGGVGWYPDQNFTHVDTGSVRYWKR